MARLMAEILIFRFRYASVLLLIFLAAAVPAAAQYAPYRFDHWTTDNGLPQNTLRMIVQTRDGYLWLTTFDGLARFDGVRFTVFDKSNTPAITNNRFTALYEDKDGTLWAGADQGEVVSYRAGIFTAYASPDMPRGASITNFRRDFNDELLIITGARAYYLRVGKFTLASSEYSNPRLKLYCGSSGTRWTIDARGARQFKDGLETHYPIKFDWDEGVSGMDAYEDNGGDLWLGDRSSVYRLRAGRVTRYTERDGLPPRFISRPQCEDDDGGVWFSIGATLKDGSGVVRFKDGRFTVYGGAAGLPPANYNQIIKDREGSIWGATSSGLYRLRKELITTRSTADGLPHNEVYPLLKTRDGRVWAGTVRGLSLFQSGQVASNPLSNFKEVVQSLCEDRAGRLWIGLLGSVRRYENGKMKNLTPLQTDGAPVWAIHEDRTRAVWVATNRGLLKFEGDRVAAHYTTKDGLPSDDVKVIHESLRNDGQSELWFGTYGGLARFKDGKFTAYTTAHGLAGNHVRSLHEDFDGTLWIGTYDDGLSRFRDGKFFSYRTEHGLFNNGVFQILEDRRGYFWIGCNKGIYRISRRELNDLAEGRVSRINSVVFGKQDGMINSECNGGRQPAGLVADDGRLWFPTMGGVAVIDPEAAQFNSPPPPVMIESVTLERDAVDFLSGVRLAPGQRDLEINYTGLSLIKSEQVKFKYKLEGLDPNWIDAETRRVAYFPYLPPGSYRFRVIAANSDGIWNDEGASLDIFVATPFYQAWWFFALSLIAVSGLGFSIYRYRVAQLRKEHSMKEAFSQQMLESQKNFSRQLLESQEGERGRIAAELHDSLGQRLLIIKNWATLSLMLSPADAPAREQLDEISETASLALEETRQIVYDLRPYQLDKIGLTSTLKFTVEQIAASSGIQITSEIAELDGAFGLNEEITFYRIVQECLNNIVKHSAATAARVRIERDDSAIRLQVTDNGRGFVVSSLDGKNRGFGLAGMVERVRMLEGNYSIESVPGEGTTISITIDTVQQ